MCTLGWSKKVCDTDKRWLLEEKHILLFLLEWYMREPRMKHITFADQSITTVHLHCMCFNVACHTNCWSSPPIIRVSLRFMNRLWQAVSGMSLWWIWTCVLWATAYYCQSRNGWKYTTQSILFHLVFCGATDWDLMGSRRGYLANTP